MDEQIRQALADEILSQLNGLGNLELGSKEQQTAIDNVTKLYRLGLEDVKADTDYDEKLYRRDADAQHEQNELDKQAREEEFKKKTVVGADQRPLFQTWNRSDGDCIAADVLCDLDEERVQV